MTGHTRQSPARGCCGDSRIRLYILDGGALQPRLQRAIGADRGWCIPTGPSTTNGGRVSRQWTGSARAPLRARRPSLSRSATFETTLVRRKKKLGRKSASINNWPIARSNSSQSNPEKRDCALRPARLHQVAPRVRRCGSPCFPGAAGGRSWALSVGAPSSCRANPRALALEVGAEEGRPARHEFVGMGRGRDLGGGACGLCGR